MKRKIELTRVSLDDWEAVYLKNKCIMQHHHIFTNYSIDIISMILKPLDVELIYTVYYTEDFTSDFLDELDCVGRLPSDLDEVKNHLK